MDSVLLATQRGRHDQAGFRSHSLQFTLYLFHSWLFSYTNILHPSHSNYLVCYQPAYKSSYLT